MYDGIRGKIKDLEKYATLSYRLLHLTLVLHLAR